MEIIEQRKDIMISSNGFVEVTPDPVEEGVAALERVGVTTNVPSAYPATLNVTENGAYSPQEGSMYNSVVVDVQSGGAVQESKTVEITTSGEHTITPDEGYDGIASTTVNVKAVGEWRYTDYDKGVPVQSWNSDDGYGYLYYLDTDSLVNGKS